MSYYSTIFTKCTKIYIQFLIYHTGSIKYFVFVSLIIFIIFVLIKKKKRKTFTKIIDITCNITIFIKSLDKFPAMFDNYWVRINKKLWLWRLPTWNILLYTSKNIFDYLGKSARKQESGNVTKNGGMYFRCPLETAF